MNSYGIKIKLEGIAHYLTKEYGGFDVLSSQMVRESIQHDLPERIVHYSAVHKVMVDEFTDFRSITFELDHKGQTNYWECEEWRINYLLIRDENRTIFEHPRTAEPLRAFKEDEEEEEEEEDA